MSLKQETRTPYPMVKHLAGRGLHAVFQVGCIASHRDVWHSVLRFQSCGPLLLYAMLWFLC